MDLLERDAALHALDAALADAARGEGRVALVSGEAGIGKTALVDRFARTQRSAVCVLWGACDALATPRPLGPLRDMAAQLPETVRAPLATGADRAAVFTAVLDALRGRPTLAVVEDVHWADEATLDLLRFLGRRIARTTALLALTYRDDELGPRHPLRALLGDLAASPAARRLPLPPLSEQAVRVLAGQRPIDAVALHRRTGGNPFFVTEVLSGDGTGVPPTVRDAVLARAARLSPSGQAVLEAAAVIGPRVEPWLLAALTAADAPAAEECLAIGMLVAQGAGLAFRHELARQAVLDALSPLRRAALHRMALDALRAAPATPDAPARLAHHAAAAGDGDAVLAHAPVAARQAAAAGAHREAAALYALALPFAEALPPAERAAFFGAHARECYFSVDLPTAIASQRRAGALWEAIGDRRRQGEHLATLAHLHLGVGDHGAARAACQAAIDLLEGLPPGRELALAYRRMALLHQYNHDLADAIALAERAIPIAERAGDAEILAATHDTLGLALMYLDFERGRQHLLRALDIARAAGLAHRVATAYGNLGSNAVELFRLDLAERYLADGLAYLADRDLDHQRLYIVGWLAAAHLYRGRWPEAAAAAAEVVGSASAISVGRWAALLALGRLRARRGDLGARASLDEALAEGDSMGDFQVIAPVRVARAEAAWLAGEPALTRAEADSVYAEALAKRYTWIAGELAFWRWRAGVAGPPPDWIAAPFLAQIAGDWAGAAGEWERLGCPYEQARALADGDGGAQAAALAIFDQLGARPAAAALRRAMRAGGAAHVPRGPYAAARTNPFGLTARQLDILGLLADGLSNTQIAARLSVSPKTADHHVTAILTKLDVHSRREAAALARRHRLVDEIWGGPNPNVG